MPKQQASVLRYCSSLQILLFYMYYTDQEAEKAILVGVALQSEGITYEQMTEYLDELSFLAETAGTGTCHFYRQRDTGRNQSLHRRKPGRYGYFRR